MKNWLKKVLSLLIALALLVSAGALAFAENNGEPIDTAAAENAAQTEADEEAARKAAEEEAARKAAEEEAARKAAEEEAARKAAEEEAARKAAEEEAARKAAEEEAARKAAEEEAARQAAEEAAAQEAAEQATAQEAAEPAPAQETAEEASVQEGAEQAAEEAPQDDESVPTYNNEETPETTSAPEGDEDTVEIDGWGYVDPEIIPDYVPDITTEIKFPEAVELHLDQAVSGSVDAENRAEYIFVYGSSKTLVLSLEASSEDVNVEINKKTVRFTKDETVTSGFSGSCELNVTAGNEYDIVLTSSSPVSYKLIVKDATAVQEESKPEETAAGKTENKEEGNKPAGGSNDTNTSETEETAGNENSGNNTAAPVEEEVPPMTGWISANGENFHIGDTVTLKAESESVLGDMVAWQTKVGNDGSWKGAGYGGTLTVELTAENNNSAYRFRMEDGNYSSEYVLTAAAETTEETKETEEAEVAEEAAVEEAEEAETENTEVAEETEAEESEAEETETAEDAEAVNTETAEETENEEAEETEEPEERKVSFSYFWDDEEPSIGSIVHMKAEVIGYEDIDYTLQWQYSEDPETFGWTDYPGANGETFDLQITEENNNFFWRVSVFLDEKAE